MVRLIALFLALVPAVSFAQSTVPPPLDANTGVRMITVTTSPTTILLTEGVPTTSGVAASTGYPTYPIVSIFPVMVTQSGVVYISKATITITPASATASPSLSSHAGGTNRGAIAGGVIGACAVIIAVIATMLWFRRRSSAHWKAKSRRRWGNLGAKPPLLPVNDSSTDDKPAISRQYVDMQKDDPFKDPEVEAPPPALYIREHRQPAHNPFADPSESPTCPRTHTRNASSINPLLPSSSQ